MNIGNFTIQYHNSDGSIIIRWQDPVTKKHFAHIMKDPNELFEPVLEKVFADRNDVVSMFEFFQTNTIDFLNSPDGYMMSPTHNAKLVDEKYTDLQYRWQAGPEQVFEWDVASFVYAYNTYFDKKVDYKDVLPLVQRFRTNCFY